MTKDTIIGTQTLEKGLLVLECIVESKTTSLTKLAKHLGMNKSTLYRYLTSYKKMGYIGQDENDGYFLTDKLIKMASGVVPQMEIRNIALPYLNSLAKLTEFNSNIGFWNGKEILYLAQKRPHPIPTFMVGETIPAYCSALGKAILAYLPENELEEYFKKITFTSFTANTITTVDKLRQDLLDIRKLGYAVMNGEMVLGLFGVAIPIFAGHTVPKYAISLASSLDRDFNDFIAKSMVHLKNVAEQISNDFINHKNIDHS